MKECIILAGGLGTRLQSVVSDVPKCMAQVAGKPFLQYLLGYLQKEKFSHIVLALGYKSEIVIEWLDQLDIPIKVSYVIEEEPLGTGGAIALAFNKIETDKAFVINGDTYFAINSEMFLGFHNQHTADISISLKPMINFDRYGSVEIDASNKILSFHEKEHKEKGLINGGVYLIQKQIFNKLNLPNKFSFEKDIMEAHVNKLNIFGCEQNEYFIDIGIPSDFEKANQDFK